MRLFNLPDGSIDKQDFAQWVLFFDIGGASTAHREPVREVYWGPGRLGPWHAARVPLAEAALLQQAPGPAPAVALPGPEVGFPPMPGTPWFRATIQEGLRFSPGTGVPAPPPATLPLLRPRVSRVLGRLKGERRLGRHTEEVQTILNSLLDQGHIQMTAPNPLTYKIISGALTGTGPPTANTDASVGAVVGCSYVNTTASTVYFCVSASIGAAVWKGPF